jgi:hypothetical protein
MDLPEQAEELRAEERPEMNAEWIHLRWERGTRYYEVYLH